MKGIHDLSPTKKAKNRARIQARNTELGKLIKWKRDDFFSQEYCADLISVATETFRRIEAGETAVTLAQLEILMEELGISQEEIWPRELNTNVTRVFTFTVRAGQQIDLTFKAVPPKESK